MKFTELHSLHISTCLQARETMEKKNHDYTNGSDSPFSNFEMASMIGIDPRLGLLLRILDKIKRMETFISKGELKVTNESFDDAIEDVINYMILLKGLNIQLTEENQRSLKIQNVPCYYCNTSDSELSRCNLHTN